MSFITLEPGGSRPPTTEEKAQIRTAIGVDTISRTLVAGPPVPGNPTADRIGQWVRRETGVPNLYDWYQWNGAAWAFVRRDGLYLTLPYSVGAISGSVALNRINGEAQYGTVGGNLVLDAPTNFTVGQKLVIDLKATGNFTLSFTAGVQMPGDARAVLPIDLVLNEGYRIRLSNISGNVWLDDIEGPVVD